MAAKENHPVPPIITPLLVIPLPKSSSADLDEPIPFLLVQFFIQACALAQTPKSGVCLQYFNAWMPEWNEGFWVRRQEKSPTLQNGKSIGSHSSEKRSLICCLNNNAWFIFSFSVLLFLIRSKSIGSCQLRNFLEENGCKRKKFIRFPPS